MTGALSLQQAPPFSVAARFLISAPLFGLLAGLVLLAYGPDSISHRWTNELLAITHFLTIGFLAMSMMGAMMQLMPVLLGVVLPRPLLFSSVVHSTLFLGCISLSMAWLTEIRSLFTFATGLLGFSFGLFITVISYYLFKSQNRQVTRSMMLMALLALLITISLGIYLAAGHAVDSILIARQLTGLHLSWGLLGWVVMLIMAVAYQVIPMFQITNDYPAIQQRWMGWLLFVNLLIYSLAYIWPATRLQTLLSQLLALCVILFAIISLWILYKRHRRVADVSLRFWQLAMTSLAVTGLCWSANLIIIDLPELFIGVMMIHGFAMTSVNGMMYKILPFIIWLHLSSRNKQLRDNGNREGQIKVPHMRNIISSRASMWQLRIHFISLVLMLLSSLGLNSFYYPSAVALVASQALLLFNLLNAGFYYYARITEFKTKLPQS